MTRNERAVVMDMIELQDHSEESMVAAWRQQASTPDGLLTARPELRAAADRFAATRSGLVDAVAKHGSVPWRSLRDYATASVGREREIRGWLRQLDDRIWNAVDRPVAMTDASARLTRVNPRLCKLTAFTQKELIGRHASVLGQDFSEAAHDALHLILELQYLAARDRVQVVRRVDSPKTCAVTFLPHGSDPERGMFVMFEDPDGRATIDSAPGVELARQYDGRPDPVIVFGVDGAVRYANAAAARVYGVSVERLLRVSSFELSQAMFDENGTPLPIEEHPGLMAALTGQPEVARTLQIHRSIVAALAAGPGAPRATRRPR